MKQNVCPAILLVDILIGAPYPNSYTLSFDQAYQLYLLPPKPLKLNHNDHQTIGQESMRPFGTEAYQPFPIVSIRKSNAVTALKHKDPPHIVTENLLAYPNQPPTPIINTK